MSAAQLHLHVQMIGVAAAGMAAARALAGVPDSVARMLRDDLARYITSQISTVDGQLVVRVALNEALLRQRALDLAARADLSDFFDRLAGLAAHDDADPYDDGHSADDFADRGH